MGQSLCFQQLKRTKDMRRKSPMTPAEARANIAAMEAETPRPAMKRLLQLALSPIGNLSPEARTIYAKKLAGM